MKFRSIIAVFLVLMLSSCIPSLGDTVKLEGGAGTGAGGSSCIYLGDMFAVPPQQPLEKSFVLPSGQRVFYGPVTYLIEFVKLRIENTIQQVFEAFNDRSGDGVGAAESIVVYSFTLWIIFYGMFIMMGVVRADGYEVVMTVGKVMIILMLVTSWDNFSFFVKDMAEGFNEGLIGIVSQALPYNDNIRNPLPGDNPDAGVTNFRFADDIVSVVLSYNTVKFLYALFSPELGPGWLYGLIMVFFVYYFVVGLLKAVYIFVIALIVRGVLFAIAPIFIPLLLFRKTKPLFDGWIKQLLNFTIMPVILFAFLGFFYSMIWVFLEEMTKESPGSIPTPVCYGTAYKMPGDLNEWFTVMFGSPGDKVSGQDAQVPVDMMPILVLLVLAYVFRHMTQWAIDLSGSLTQAFTNFRSAGAPEQLRRQLGSVARGGRSRGGGTAGGAGFDGAGGASGRQRAKIG